MQKQDLSSRRSTWIGGEVAVSAIFEPNSGGQRSTTMASGRTGRNASQNQAWTSNLSSAMRTYKNQTVDIRMPVASTAASNFRKKPRQDPLTGMVTPVHFKEFSLDRRNNSLDRDSIDDTESQKRAKIETQRLAYDMYSPVIHFQNEKIIKRQLDSFIEKQGSRMGNYELENKDKRVFAEEFNKTRLKLATAGTKNRTSLLQQH